LQVTDPQHRLLIETVHDALQDAGYDKKPLDRANTGVFVGASVSEYKDILTIRLRTQSIADGTFGDALSPAEAGTLKSAVANVTPTRAFTIAGSLLNMMAATVSQVFDLSGPSFTLDAACSSALVAIHEAAVHLRAQQCHVALAGGIYLNLAPDNLVGFSRIQAISPSGTCRPFDARADGFVMGEGVGVVVLKRLADARRDGDRIYAVICGTGCNNDGRSEGPMTPRAEGQIDAMQRAHGDAGDFSVETIEFVETHGTATAVGDAVEVGALRRFFETCAGRELTEPFCYLGSIKANIGHTMSAAGVAGFIKSVLAVQQGIIPPQPSIEIVNPKLGLDRSPFRIAQEALPWQRSATHPRRAAVSSFGFGGTNAHILLEEVPNLATDCTEREELFLVSAPTDELLSRHLLELATVVEENSVTPAAVAYTLAARARFDVAVAFLARGRGELVCKLRREASIPHPAASFGQQKLAFLFPSESILRVGLLRDLFDRFSAFRTRLLELDNAVADTAIGSFVQALYPNEPFCADAATRRLAEPQISQPAIVSLGIALADLLGACGTRPDVVLGLRFGEIAAASIGGMLSAEDAVRLAHRSQLRSGHQHALPSGVNVGIDVEIQRALDLLTLNAPVLPVVSCITGAAYASVDEAKEMWRRLATAPVDFARGLASCHAGFFVHVGAGDPMQSLVPGEIANAARFFSLAPIDRNDGGHMLLETIGQLFVQGIPIDARPLMRDSNYTLTTLPPTPLEKQHYWAIEGSGQLSRQPRVILSDQAEVPMDGLLEVMRQQLALLESQQEVMKSQAAALQALGKAMTPKISLLPSNPDDTDAGAPPSVQPDLTLRPTLRQEVESRILSSVARISAFPTTSLRLGQALTAELGFDSLMLVDLDREVDNAWPEIGGLLPDVLTPQATIQDVVDHIVLALETGLVNQTEVNEAAPTAAVDFYVPTVVPAPLAKSAESVLIFDAPLLITRDHLGLADALKTELELRGVSAQIGAVDSGGAFSGIIHLAQIDAAGDVSAPSLSLLRLAQRFGKGANVFITVTGLGGRFGLDVDPIAKLGQVGALGFTKALAREWPGALVKAIDLDIRLETAAVARAVVDELFSGDRTPEVGFTSEGRVAIELQHNLAKSGTELTAESVVLVTGGASGLGLVFGRGLAKRHGCVVALTGRTAPDAENVRMAVASIISAGARACTYHVMDVRNVSSVNRGFESVRAAHGRVDVLVHAAGVRFDAPVSKKQSAEFSDVIDTKVLGAQRLLKAAGNSLKLGVFIGSWAGHFGNAGQTDYSAANAMMARLSVSCPIPTVAIDFPPLKGSASVNRIAVFRKRRMQEAGVTFLSDDESATAFLDAIAYSRGEVIIGRSLPERVFDARTAFPISRLNHVYLDSHVIDGQRVLPFAAAMDYVATAALERIGHGDFQPFGISDFHLKRPVLVPDTIWLNVDVSVVLQRGGRAHADVTLSQDNALCYRGIVGAAKDQSDLHIAIVPPASLPVSLGEFYDRITFHGPRLQGIVSIDGFAPNGVSGTVKGCTVNEWINQPLRQNWTIDPLVIDSGFQLAAYWIWIKHGHAGFPLAFEEYTQLAPFDTGPVQCTARLESAEGGKFRGTITWHDLQGRLLAVMRGVVAETKVRNLGLPTATPQDKPRVRDLDDTQQQSVAGAPPIEPANYEFDKFPEYQELKERLQLAAALGIPNPYFRVHERICNDTTQVNGNALINFSSYNYLDYSGDPVVSAAAKTAIERYGTSVSASRVASGERPLHAELEYELARFLGTEDCLVFTSGHATNVTVIGHLVGGEDLILHDELAHDSIIQGAKLSGAKRRPFAHNDHRALDRALTELRNSYRRVLVCIEGAYSMDGDIPDLPKLIEVKKRHHALLLIDEAHSVGVIGLTGRGIGEYHHVTRRDVDVWMGTLSKSLASCGGYISGSRALIEYLKYTTPGFVYSVGMSPPNAAAALAALRQLVAQPERVSRLQTQARKFVGLLQSRGINTGRSKDTAVVPAIIGDSVLCLRLADRLGNCGINVQPILYPAVAESASRLRFFLSCAHTDDQLTITADTLVKELKRLRQDTTARVAIGA
jgi:8-amino-7-oxononanoate synthase